VIMGNRAVITFSAASSAPCIYLHWDGGRCSVQAMLDAARHLNMDAPLQGMGDPMRFDAQAKVLDAIADMVKRWGGSAYRETYGSADTDNQDNGVYYIDEELQIVKRLFKRHDEEIDEAKQQRVYQGLIEAMTSDD